MKTIAVVNQKGGSGKTTLAVHLAVHATELGQTASILDLDAQKSASEWWKLRKKLQDKDAPAVAFGMNMKLARMIEAARTEDVDLALIDTPPAVNSTMLHAAETANLVLIPSRLNHLDLQALEETLVLLAKAKLADKCLVVANCVPEDDEDGLGRLADVAGEAGVAVSKTILAYDADFAAAIDEGLGISETITGGAAESIAMLYRDVMRRLAAPKSGARRRGK